MPGVDDAVLVDAYRAGNNGAFEAIVRRHYAGLLERADRRCGRGASTGSSSSPDRGGSGTVCCGMSEPHRGQWTSTSWRLGFSRRTAPQSRQVTSNRTYFRARRRRL